MFFEDQIELKLPQNSKMRVFLTNNSCASALIVDQGQFSKILAFFYDFDEFLLDRLGRVLDIWLSALFFFVLRFEVYENSYTSFEDDIKFVADRVLN